MKTKKSIILLFVLMCSVAYTNAQSWQNLKRRAKNEIKQEVSKSVRKTVSAGVTKSVTLGSIPTTFEEFETKYDELGQSAEGAIAMFLAAMDIYAQDEELGEKCFGLCFHPDKRNGELPNNYFLSFMHSRFHVGDGQPWIARSYFVGAKPENGYTPKEPYVLKMKSRNGDDDYLTSMDADIEKRWLQSSGADSERAVQVLRVKGENLYYMFEYGGLPSQIRKPKRK